ncbi:hypothetical protein [Mesorhizobium sp.]|uniref:hypothetical protein n=1 Tax=Mesorhizobium sp. TaxID=1871066 RepID=UPI0025C030CE|nr:hypothetical protein [Mesorhizobium sp.]
MFTSYGQPNPTLSSSIENSTRPAELVAGAPCRKASLSEMAIRDFENGIRNPRPHKIAAMRQAFEDAGITFTFEGAQSLARPEGHSGLATTNRMWRRRQRQA